jgi:hypothetical protein
MTQPTINLTGKSGTLYIFEIWPFNTTWNPVPANYVVSRLESTGTYTLLYGGQAIDLKDRFSNHHKKDCFKNYQASHLLVRQEINEANRLAIEKDINDNYSMPCND